MFCYCVVFYIRLTDKELEIMQVLWDNETPMTGSEIVSASKDRTWKEKSIYIIVNSLLKKNAIAFDHYKSTATNTARVYRAAISLEEYAALNVLELNPDIVSVITAIFRGKKFDKTPKEILYQVLNNLED